jgi:hypothetical protein
MTFLLKAYRTFNKVHILGHKTKPKKNKRFQMIQIIFSDQKEIQLGINNRTITGKSPSICLIENSLQHGTKGTSSAR